MRGVFSGPVPGRNDEDKLKLTVHVGSGGPAGGEYHYQYVWRSDPPPPQPDPGPLPPDPVDSPGLAGAWTSGGQAASIIQEAQGGLVLVAPDGSRSKGRMEGLAVLVATEWGDRKGIISEGGRAIRWSDGAVWTRGESVPPLRMANTSWIVNGQPVPWVFSEGGLVGAKDLWTGRWTATGPDIEMTITHQGVNDTFLIIVSADGQSFTAYKDGKAYRSGVRAK